MRLLRPRDLGHWDAVSFVLPLIDEPFLRMYLPHYNVVGWWGEFDRDNFTYGSGGTENIDSYNSPFLFNYFFDKPEGPYVPGSDYSSNPSIPWSVIEDCTLLDHTKRRYFIDHYDNERYDEDWPQAFDDTVNSNSTNSVVFNNGMTNNNSERLANTLKKARNKDMNTTEMNNDEKYVAAIMRPNVLTSEYYAETFLHDNEISFTFHRMDPGFVLTEAIVDKWVNHYKNTIFPKLTVSLEKGIYAKGSVRSVRMVVLNEKRELVLIWLCAGNSYSIHYKKHEEVSELLDFLQTTHIPVKRMIHRCYNTGGGRLNISDVAITGLFQIHDEFYPQLHEYGGMTKLVDDFGKSSSNLMILAGQWGGGKSALFQAICWRDETAKNSYYLLDDPSIYAEAELFSSIISRIEEDNRNGICSWLFLEEADDFVRSKKNNPFLSRLASLTSGAASLNVKIIVATNDGSESMIDAALTRSGRLFAMVKFGLLTPEQANAARKALSKDPIAFSENVALSEALTDKPVFAGIASAKKAATGFGFAPAKAA